MLRAIVIDLSNKGGASHKLPQKFMNISKLCNDFEKQLKFVVIFSEKTLNMIKILLFFLLTQLNLFH